MALTADSIFEDKFLILQELGVGAFGEVYKAREIELHRVVAIKILREHCDIDSRNRFVREAQIMSVLRHPAVASLYHFGRTIQDGAECFYIVMEYVEGETLAARLSRDERIDPLTAIGICSRVCEGLQAAHKLDIVHRDLSPANIMIESGGTAKIIDFGLARLQNTNVQALTISMKLVGNPFYMSPEQCACEKLDGRSDIYSLGCVLYQMLSGCTVFDADVGLGILFKHRHEAPPDLHQYGIDPEIEAVVNKCLAKRPGDRYQTADELASDLKMLMQRTGIFEIAPIKPESSAKKLTPTARIILSVSVALFFVCCGFIALSYWQKSGVHKDSLGEVPYRAEDWSGRGLLEQGDRIHREHSLRKMNAVSSSLSDLSPDQVRWCCDLLDELLAKRNASINQEEFRSLFRSADDFGKHGLDELKFKALKLAFMAGSQYIRMQNHTVTAIGLASLLDLSVTFDALGDYSRFEDHLRALVAKSMRASDEFEVTGHWLNYRLNTQKFQIVDYLIERRVTLAYQMVAADKNNIDSVAKLLLDDMRKVKSSGAGSPARVKRFMVGFDKIGAPRTMLSFKAKLLSLAYAMSNDKSLRPGLIQALKSSEVAAGDSPKRFEDRFALVSDLNYCDTPEFSRDLLLHALSQSPTKEEVNTIVDLGAYVCANLGFIGLDTQANTLLNEMQMHADKFDGIANSIATARFMNLAAQNRSISAMDLCQKQMAGTQPYDLENIKWMTAFLSVATRFETEPNASSVCTSLKNRLARFPPTSPLNDNAIFLLGGGCRSLIYGDYENADKQIELLDYRLKCRPPLAAVLTRKYAGGLLTERLGSEGLLQDRCKRRTMDLAPAIKVMPIWRFADFTSGTALLVLHLLRDSDFEHVDSIVQTLEQRCASWPGALRDVRALQLCRVLAPVRRLSVNQIENVQDTMVPVKWLPGVTAFCQAKLSDLCPPDADDVTKLALTYKAYQSLRNSPATYRGSDYARSKERLGSLLLKQRHFVEYAWLFQGNSWQKKPLDMNGVAK